MSQNEKSRYFRALKNAGVKFDKHYREYNTRELAEACKSLGLDVQRPEPKKEAEPPELSYAYTAKEARKESMAAHPAGKTVVFDDIPFSDEPLEDLAGLHQNEPERPLRRDSRGRVWFQEEIRKKGYAAPRARRKLQYKDSGAKRVEVRNGEYVESFEVAGDNNIPSEVKVTLPTYQVGIYKDPRFPFRIHTYDNRRGFDLFEVQRFYGGAELVPTEIKRIYVENVLCYDMRTTIRAIETEARQLQLSQMKGMAR